MIETSAFEIGQRFTGIKEVPGSLDNPMVMAMLRLTPDGGWDGWPDHDEVPWCSAFMNYVCWILRLPRSKSLRARSWLQVGRVVNLNEARVDCDVVVLKRGEGAGSAGPDVIDAPGHVGFFAGIQNGSVMLLGGNQNNTVSVKAYPVEMVLGVRRLM